VPYFVFAVLSRSALSPCSSLTIASRAAGFIVPSFAACTVRSRTLPSTLPTSASALSVVASQPAASSALRAY
jgi:hypothetical protein